MCRQIVIELSSDMVTVIMGFPQASLIFGHSSLNARRFLVVIGEAVSVHLQTYHSQAKTQIWRVNSLNKFLDLIKFWSCSLNYHCFLVYECRDEQNICRGYPAKRALNARRHA